MFEESETGDGDTGRRLRSGPGEGWETKPGRRERKSGLEKQVVGVITEPLCLSPSYIWQHIEIGYVQGMCDLLAPLLVILDDGECVLPTPGLGVQCPSHCRGGGLI